MTGDEIPKDVCDLLREHIETYEQLEVLLLLRSDRALTWTADSVAGKLNIPRSDAEKALSDLYGSRLLVCTDSQRQLFRYSPANLDLADATERLARAYDEKRLEIIKRMSEYAMERVRTAAIRTFADAFLLGRNKKDG